MGHQCQNISISKYLYNMSFFSKKHNHVPKNEPYKFLKKIEKCFVTYCSDGGEGKITEKWVYNILAIWRLLRVALHVQNNGTVKYSQIFNTSPIFWHKPLWLNSEKNAILSLISLSILETVIIKTGSGSRNLCLENFPSILWWVLIRNCCLLHFLTVLGHSF